MTLAMTVSSFADIEITKTWDDDLAGSSAKNRSTPTVTITGETSYEKLLNLFYPVGCYFETTDTSFDPNTAWGGTWEEDTSGRVIVGAGDDYTVGEAGGSKTHDHLYGLQFAGYYQDTVMENTTNTGIMNYRTGTPVVGSRLTDGITVTVNGNNSQSTTANRTGCAVYLSEGYTQAVSSMQPYIVAKRWHRTA